LPGFVFIWGDVVFHYLQKSSKLLAQFAGLIYKIRLLLRFIMTRIMTNPELIKPGRISIKSQLLWFCREEVELVPAASSVWVSDILRSGTVIDQIKIQCRSNDPATLPLGGASIVLLSSKNPTLVEVLSAENVIQFRELTGVYSWRSCGIGGDETWELRKVVTGSDLRIAIALVNFTVCNINMRVSVRYEA
jgi:hypothetical protein